MDSGSKSVEENAAAKWEVGPTEDLVQAFMETLVDPRLPLRASATDPPSQDDQKSIARQMHAVVLLYNYYHRKQNPELELLDFVSFCKLAVSLRPPLLAFMKLMNESQSMELNGAEVQLSVTEKAMKDACDIALALDASTNVPNTEGWPVSKIAVLLIDKSNENFRLQFGAITEGVWSTYEKDINKSYTFPEVSVENKVGTGGKRKKNAEILQLAYDIVKEVTGIDSSGLVVMGSHITYSLSKEKTANRVYLIQCPQTFSPSDEVPVKFLLESLQGPFAKKAFGSWTSTAAVEYHHMLPYLGFVSLCLSGCQEQLTQSRISPSPVSNSNNHSEAKTESCDKRADHNSDNNRKKCRKSSDGEASTAVNTVKRPANLDKERDESQKVDSLSDPSRGLKTMNMDETDNLNVGMVDLLISRQCIDEKLSAENGDFTVSNDHNGVSDQNGDNRLPPLDGVAETNAEAQSAQASDQLIRTALAHLYGKRKELYSQICSMEDELAVYEDNIERIRDGGNVGLARLCIKSIISGNNNLMLKHESQIQDMVNQPENLIYRQNSSNGVSDQNGDKRLPPVDGAENNVEAQSVQASDELRNALALLYRKREEMNSQICSIEDELAVYQDNIERIRDGGNVGLARLCIKSIISGNKNLMQKHDSQIQDKVNQPEKDHSRSISEKQIPGTSSCEDLEYTCLENNWRLPRYIFIPLNAGKFLSNVLVGSKDFSLSSEGDSKSNPGEARESAAAKMLAKLDYFDWVDRS